MKPKSLTFDMHFDKAECYLILNRYKADNTLPIDAHWCTVDELINEGYLTDE